MRNLTASLLAACLSIVATGAWAADARPPQRSKPNVLIVIADDATFDELSLYGGKNLRTPHVDRLAQEGLLFRRAYLCMSMCWPCRAELYTGRYPLRNGTCWNHAPARPGTRSITHYLGELGYRVGLAGKVHATPRSVYDFEMVDGFERNCVALTADHDCRGIRQFMARDAQQPFCLVVALVVPHMPWTVGDPRHFDPAKLVLPKYLVDTPETRQAYAKYLAEYEVMDQQLGDILHTLDESGQAARTLVLFTTEQGGQWPGCKWTNWEQGVHTALLARWPGHIAPGSRSDALVQYADVLPTLVEAAGGQASPGALDGTSFLKVLEGRAEQHRRFVYGMHNNLPEGPPYPIRSVHDGRFHYLRNLTPAALYFEKHMMGTVEHGPYWLSWVWKAAADAQALKIVERFMRRPAEELYDTQTDPLELNNLAADPRQAACKARLATELDRWLSEQRDPGAALDSEPFRTKALSKEKPR